MCNLSIDLRGQKINYQILKDVTACDPITTLPQDIWKIFQQYFNFQDYVVCARVSKKWCQFVEETKISEIVAVRFGEDIKKKGYKERVSETIIISLYKAKNAEIFPRNYLNSYESIGDGLLEQLRLVGLGFYDFKKTEEKILAFDQNIFRDSRKCCEILLQQNLIDEALYIFEKYNEFENEFLIEKFIDIFCNRNEWNKAIEFYVKYEEHLPENRRNKIIEKFCLKAIKNNRFEIIIMIFNYLDKHKEENNKTLLSISVSGCVKTHNKEIKQFLFENPHFLFDTLKIFGNDQYRKLSATKKKKINKILSYIFTLSIYEKEIKNYFIQNLNKEHIYILKILIYRFCEKKWLDEAFFLFTRFKQDYFLFIDREVILKIFIHVFSHYGRWDLTESLLLSLLDTPSHTLRLQISKYIKLQQNSLLHFFLQNPTILCSTLKYWLDKRDLFIDKFSDSIDVFEDLAVEAKKPHKHTEHLFIDGGNLYVEKRYYVSYTRKELEMHLKDILTYILKNFKFNYLLDPILEEYLPTLGLFFFQESFFEIFGNFAHSFEQFYIRCNQINEATLCYAFEQLHSVQLMSKLIDKCISISPQTFKYALKQNRGESELIQLLAKCKTIDKTELEWVYNGCYSEHLQKAMLNKCNPIKALQAMIKSQKFYFLPVILDKIQNLSSFDFYKVLEAGLDDEVSLLKILHKMDSISFQDFYSSYYSKSNPGKKIRLALTKKYYSGFNISFKTCSII